MKNFKEVTYDDYQRNEFSFIGLKIMMAKLWWLPPFFPSIYGLFLFLAGLFIGNSSYFIVGLLVILISYGITFYLRMLYIESIKQRQKDFISYIAKEYSLSKEYEEYELIINDKFRQRFQVLDIKNNRVFDIFSDNKYIIINPNDVVFCNPFSYDYLCGVILNIEYKNNKEKINKFDIPIFSNKINMRSILKLEEIFA